MDSTSEVSSPFPTRRVLLGNSRSESRSCREVIDFHCCSQASDSHVHPVQVSNPEHVTRMSSTAATGTSPIQGAAEIAPVVLSTETSE